MICRRIALLALPLLLWAASPEVEKAKKLTGEGKHEEAITLLQTYAGKKPAPADAKKALSEAHTAYGEALMFNKDMPPFRKYPAALKQFRAAVAQDANAKKAKEHIDTIEGIYKSMGRPVPQ
jgi:tetratricopeptide (TPR) repeat protein